MFLLKRKLDITYVVSLTRHFMHNPSELHMKVIVWVLKRLKLTLDSGMLFQKPGGIDLRFI